MKAPATARAPAPVPALVRAGAAVRSACVTSAKSRTCESGDRALCERAAQGGAPGLRPGRPPECIRRPLNLFGLPQEVEAERQPRTRTKVLTLQIAELDPERFGFEGVGENGESWVSGSVPYNVGLTLQTLRPALLQGQGARAHGHRPALSAPSRLQRVSLQTPARLPRPQSSSAHPAHSGRPSAWCMPGRPVGRGSRSSSDCAEQPKPSPEGEA